MLIQNPVEPCSTLQPSCLCDLWGKMAMQCALMRWIVSESSWRPRCYNTQGTRGLCNKHFIWKQCDSQCTARCVSPRWRRMLSILCTMLCHVDMFWHVFRVALEPWNRPMKTASSNSVSRWQEIMAFRFSVVRKRTYTICFASFVCNLDVQVSSWSSFILGPLVFSVTPFEGFIISNTPMVREFEDDRKAVLVGVGARSVKQAFEASLA